jgi:hypothetical protein
LRKVARDSGWIKDILSGTEGEVFKLHASEEEHAADSVPTLRNSPNIRRECSRTSN